MMGKQKSRLVGPSILSLILLATLPHTSAEQNLRPCKSHRVHYSEFDPSFSDRITLRLLKRSYKIPDDKEEQTSPQGTKRLVKTGPDYMKSGPWTTTVFIVVPDAQPIELSFLDHGNGGVQVQWLSERLLFARVWWGRIVSTDLILDVEKSAFLYREMANYGDLVEPCQ